MPIESRQRIIHEERLETMLPQMPDYVQEYIRSKRRAKYSPSSLLGYVHEYLKFFNWLLSEAVANYEDIKSIPYSVLETLSKETVELYREHIENEDIRTEKEKIKSPPAPVRRRSKDAVDRNINALKSLFSYLTTETENEDGECYFYRNVFSKIKQRKEQETASRSAAKISSKVIKSNEISGFIEYLKFDYEKGLEATSAKMYKAYLKQKERDVAMISLLLGSGIRVSELASLTLQDINFHTREIDIIRKGNKEDTVLVLQAALEELKAYLRVRQERFNTKESDIYVFVSKYKGMVQPLSVRSIQTLVNKYTKEFYAQNEFSTGKGLSPHKMRHSFANDWILQGGDIITLRDQLGHSSIETTSKYTNLSRDEGKKVIEKMEENRNK
ncbi:tyrosine recombinase XerS [Niallia taxi]|uniref:tyrosine recombinase XerS n=1 Tax=Niallia taxi TaxID=2499688 RepID=UPI003D29348C